MKAYYIYQFVGLPSFLPSMYLIVFFLSLLYNFKIFTHDVWACIYNLALGSANIRDGTMFIYNYFS